MIRSLVCSLLLTALAGAAPVVLVKDGAPVATVVLPADANARQESAAADLRQYVAALTGVELPLRSDGAAVDGTGIYLGQCAPTEAADLPAADLNPESFAIRVRDGDLYLTGRYPTPSAFAAASFLESDLGLRWFAPGELWTSLPAKTPGDLTVEVTSRVVVPATSPRIWSGHAWFPDWEDWNLRNKTLLGEVYPRRQFQNVMHRVFPTETYAETHPEYYPLIGDKRFIPPAGVTHWRPCESNPEVVQLVVDYARKWFDEHPTVDSFSLGMDDIAYYCGCDACRAMDPRPDSYEKKEFSDRHYKFVNAVAREIAKTHPDRYIGTLIYHSARKLPETVDKLEPNVFGFLTETSALWSDPERKAADQALSRAWAERTSHISRYDYYGFASITPRFYPHLVDEQIKFDKSLGFEGMYIEVYTFLPITAPMIWATAKLQWDPSLDIDALLDEFCAKMYGPAGATMRRFYDVLEASYTRRQDPPQGWEHRNLTNQARAITPEALDEAERLITKAMLEADSEAVGQRLDIVAGGLRYGGYLIRTVAQGQKLAAMPLTDRGTAEAMADEVGKLLALAAERDAYWASAPQRDDLLGETLRGLGEKMQYLATGQIARLEAGGLAAALRLLAWYVANEPDQLQTTADKLITAAPGSNLATAARGWLWLRNNDAPNLVQNPGFEQRGENDQPAAADWTTAGAPPDWSTWSRSGQTVFGRQGEAGRTGDTAATIRESDGAVFLQAIPVEPGEKHLVVAWTKALGSASTLTIRYRTPAGAWHPNRTLESSVVAAGTGNWEPLVLSFTVPEGAGSAIVMLGVDEQTAAHQVWFDDIQCYRLPATW